jgi:hypothetical protein
LPRVNAKNTTLTFTLVKNIFLLLFKGFKILNTMVDTKYVPAWISFKNQDLGAYFKEHDYTLFKELGYTYMGFY